MKADIIDRQCQRPKAWYMWASDYLAWFLFVGRWGSVPGKLARALDGQVSIVVLSAISVAFWNDADLLLRRNRGGMGMFRYARAGLVTIGLIAPSVVLAADSPSTNIEIVEKQIAEMNRGDWKTALDLYTPDSRNFGRKVGGAVMAKIFQDIYATFPDFKQQIVEIVAVGDSVIVRGKMSGTHNGVGRIPVNGGMLVGVTPTKHCFEVDAIHWIKLKDGKIADHFAVRDDLKMMQDLGLSTQPAAFDWAAFAAEANTKQ